MTRIVQIEFNELCPSLLDKWMKAGELPNFSRFHAESDVFVTEADETNPLNLEPWIQWYSVHTGLPFAQHGVFHLTDGPRAGYDDVWTILRRAGHSVWNCSSMNARKVSGDGAFFLPDPWCDVETPYPDEMGSFYKIISQQVKEYSNKDNKPKLADIVAFAKFMVSHGLSFGTIFKTVKQLASEVFGGKAERFKRVAILDLLLFDVFKHYFEKEKPDFSTFFLNSTAHLQHTYWRQMQPDAFTVKPTQEEVETYGDAILFGYKKMDELLGRFLRMADPDTILVFVTALSQQPFLKHEAIGGQRFYRPKSIDALLKSLDIHPVRAEPVMTHQFVLRFDTEAEALAAKEKIAAVRSDGVPVFGIDEAEPTDVYMGCTIRGQLTPASTIDLGQGAAPANFFDYFYQIEGMKSGRHHPDGCLWIRRGHHAVASEKVSILDVLPTTLDLLGLPVANYQGRSLVATREAAIA